VWCRMLKKNLMSQLSYTSYAHNTNLKWESKSCGISLFSFFCLCPILIGLSTVQLCSSFHILLTFFTCIYVNLVRMKFISNLAKLITKYCLKANSNNVYLYIFLLLQFILYMVGMFTWKQVRATVASRSWVVKNLFNYMEASTSV